MVKYKLFPHMSNAKINKFVYKEIRNGLNSISRSEGSWPEYFDSSCHSR